MRTNLIGLTELSPKTESNEEETFSIPIDISDIINVCKEFSKLGWKVQSQIECIMELGIDEALKNKAVTPEALAHIKYFLQQIVSNAYFGEAADQAYECINQIGDFEERHPELFRTKVN